jgi:HEAT repeat protein
MDYSVTFARHFARLVWLLLREPANVDEQKAALRALVTVSTDGAVTLTLTGPQQLAANGTGLPGTLDAARELVLRLLGHDVSELHAEQGAAAADLLNAARTLAEEPTFGGDGPGATERLGATGARTVWFVTGRPAISGEKRRPTPKAGSTVPGSPAPNVWGGGLFEHFAAKTGGATISAKDVLARLDGARHGGALARALEDIVTLIEHAAREGKVHVGVDAFAGLVQREGAIERPELRRPYMMAIRRLSKPLVLRAVAGLLAREREWTEQCVAILVRAGAEGAEALVEMLTHARTEEDRQTFFKILLTLRAGVPSLILMLGDPRWHVVRDAAELLGEMKAAEAEGPLTPLLRHSDERVRRAAAHALVQIGTSTAVRAVQRAVSDTDNAAEVRQEAASALGRRRGERTSATTLVRALENEEEEEVQFAILAALGKVATQDAVNRLVKAAEPDGVLFRRKSIEYRVAAVRALGESGTPVAAAALRMLLNDKDREVRAAVQTALDSMRGTAGEGPSAARQSAS